MDKQRMNRLGLALLALILGACNFFAPETSVQLLEEENKAYSTEIAEIRASATAYGDRLMATEQIAQTAVRAVDQQSTRIASTLIARGTAVVDSSQLIPVTPTPLPMEAIIEGASGANNPVVNPQLITPMVTNDGAARGSVFVASTPIITPLPQVESAATPAAQAQPDTTQPTLTAIQVSSSVGADDCAVNPTTSFSDAASSIYVSARAFNLSPTNTVTSRWFYAGTQQVSYDWSPSGTVNDACIWFFITPEAVAFSAGAWSVDLLIDGSLITSASFSIAGM
jgi:hypothetical protein